MSLNKPMTDAELRKHVNDHVVRFKPQGVNRGQYTLHQIANFTWPAGKVQGVATCMAYGFSLDASIKVINEVHDQWDRDFEDECQATKSGGVGFRFDVSMTPGDPDAD